MYTYIDMCVYIYEETEAWRNKLFKATAFKEPGLEEAAGFLCPCHLSWIWY